jgi:hypothetical protein
LAPKAVIRTFLALIPEFDAAGPRQETHAKDTSALFGCTGLGVNAATGPPFAVAAVQESHVLENVHAQSHGHLAGKRARVAVHKNSLVPEQVDALCENLTPVDVHDAGNVVNGELTSDAHIEHQQLLVILGPELLGSDSAVVVIGKVDSPRER